jgi:hypothetical protein
VSAPASTRSCTVAVSPFIVATVSAALPYYTHKEEKSSKRKQRIEYKARRLRESKRNLE